MQNITVKPNQATVEANTRFRIIPKQTIHQLAKLSRRIPRVISRNSAKLRNKKLSPVQITLCRYKIEVARDAFEMLKSALNERNVNGAPLRDCTPHRLRTSAQNLQAA